MPKSRFIDDECEDEDGVDDSGEEELEETAEDLAMIDDTEYENEWQSVKGIKLTKRDRRLSKGDWEVIRGPKKSRITPAESDHSETEKVHGSDSYESDFVVPDEEETDFTTSTSSTESTIDYKELRKKRKKIEDDDDVETKQAKEIEEPVAAPVEAPKEQADKEDPQKEEDNFAMCRAKPLSTFATARKTPKWKVPSVRVPYPDRKIEPITTVEIKKMEQNATAQPLDQKKAWDGLLDSKGEPIHKQASKGKTKSKK